MNADWLRTLAAFEIAGGALGLLGYIGTVQAFPGALSAWLVALASIFCLTSMVAGLALWERSPRGIVLSLVVQGAQAISFTFGWRYVFLAGPKLIWVVASGGTGLFVGGGGGFILDPAPCDHTLNLVGLSAQVDFGLWPTPLPDTSWSVGVNLLAIYYFLKLWALHVRPPVQPRTQVAGSSRAEFEPPAA